MQLQQKTACIAPWFHTTTNPNPKQLGTRQRPLLSRVIYHVARSTCHHHPRRSEIKPYVKRRRMGFCAVSAVHCVGAGSVFRWHRHAQDEEKNDGRFQ